MRLDKYATRYEMARRKKSIAEICQLTGLSRSTVQKATNGQTSPHMATLGLIAEALEVELDVILAKER